VLFPDDTTSIVGQLAIDQAQVQPDRVARWIKRHMIDPSWRFTMGHRSLSAVDLSALILKKVVQDAQLTVGPFRDVVITVPAYFTEPERAATEEAGKRAGLNVLRIVNEPTAAALAYASSGKARGRCLVFDFGGGTFDVSIVDIASPTEVTVLATGGERVLGGHDLDRALATELNRRFLAAKGIPLMPEGDLAQEHAVLNLCESTKRQLSRLDTKTVLLARGGQTLSVDISRRDFEHAIEPFISRTSMQTDLVLQEAGLNPSNIDHVILVGGSTRIPAVVAMLQSKFGKQPTTGVSPDEAVALGAAIQCGQIMATSATPGLAPGISSILAKTTIQDITAHGYGTIYTDVNQSPPRERNEVLIPKQSQIPCTRRSTFFTTRIDQPTILLRVTQGDENEIDFVQVLVSEEVSIPAGFGEDGQQIEIEYTYNANGRLGARVTHPSSGSTQSFEYDLEKAEGTKGNPGASAAAARDWFDDLDIK
jgi:molecular chaperone DnaK